MEQSNEAIQKQSRGIRQAFQTHEQQAEVIRQNLERDRTLQEKRARRAKFQLMIDSEIVEAYARDH